MKSSKFNLNTDCAVLIRTMSSTITARKRWHIAYATIYSLRAFLSIAHQPYVILDSEPISSPASSTPGIEPTRLVEIVREKSLDAFRAVGGIRKVASSLKANLEGGIHGSNEDVLWRKELYGSNTYTRPPPKGFLFFVWNAFKDPTLIILLVAATLSLGFGIKEDGIKEGWYEGGSIFVAVFLVVVVSAISNFKQERQFSKLSKISDNILISVVRDSRPQQISIFDIVVGDVVSLKIGDQIPADGLFIDGHSLLIDESSMTGESDHVEVNSVSNPFLHSGSKVGDGYGQMLVTGVGTSTAWGEMMSSINRDVSEETPLQVRLNSLTSSIGKVGLLVAFLVLGVLIARYFTGNTHDDKGNVEYTKGKTGINSIMNSMVRIISIAVTIVVVAIPEGLPLAVTLTLAYSMKRMMADHAMVRKLSACETMGSATVICTDKTGTLTLNQMKVTQVWIGEAQGLQITAPNILELLQQGVALNSTGAVFTPFEGAEPEISGSPTEKAIISWAFKELGMDMEGVKRSSSILQVETFNSTKKRSGVMMKKNSDNSIHVHWKGAAEIILELCSSYYTPDGTKRAMDNDRRKRFGLIIEGMAASSLRCIAFAHTQVLAEELASQTGQGSAQPKLKEKELTLLGIVGLKDPCRPEVKNAVEIVNVAALVINFVAAVSAGEVPLTAVQLLWVNLIMDTLGALALATERPTKELIDKPPVGRTAPLITNIMWRNLLSQAFYQISILLIRLN